MLTSLVLAVVGGDLYGAVGGGHLGELKGIPRILPITSKSNIYEVFFLFKIRHNIDFQRWATPLRYRVKNCDINQRFPMYHFCGFGNALFFYSTNPCHSKFCHVKRACLVPQFLKNNEIRLIYWNGYSITLLFLIIFLYAWLSIYPPIMVIIFILLVWLDSSFVLHKSLSGHGIGLKNIPTKKWNIPW